MTVSVLQTGIFGVNTLIVPLEENKVFIVDPAACRFTRDEEAVTSFLASHNLEPEAIILTHGHFDHVSGLSFLKEKYPSIPILIHPADADRIGPESAKIQGIELSDMGLDQFLPAVSNLPAPTGFLEEGKTLLACLQSQGEGETRFDGISTSPDKITTPTDGASSSLDRISTPTDGISSRFGGTTPSQAFGDWTVLHTPGHTKGSVCLYNEKDKILISGDTLFFMSWGRTDLYGGSESEMQKSLTRLYKEVSLDAKVYPGHDRTGFTLSQNR